MEEEEELEAKRGDDEGGHLDDQEHGGRPDNLCEAGSECAILRWENLSNQGVRHSPHSKAIGHAGKEQCREKTDLKKDGGLVACQEDEETTEAAERSRHYRVATHKLGHSVHPGGEISLIKTPLDLGTPQKLKM